MTKSIKKPEELSIFSCTKENEEFDIASFENAPAAEVSANGIKPSKVQGPDNRDDVQDTSIMPYMAIVKLFIMAADDTKHIGTGYLTATNKVYTAGHCVYLHDHGGQVKWVRVVPGLDGNNKPFGTFTSTEVVTTFGWMDNKNDRLDMGAIKLSQNVEHGKYFIPQLTDNAEVKITGYPGERESGRKQFKHTGPAQQSNGQHIYKIDTSKGQSGSPIQIPDTNFAIGIHNKGGNSQNRGSDLYEDFIVGVKNW